MTQRPGKPVRQELRTISRFTSGASVLVQEWLDDRSRIDVPTSGTADCAIDRWDPAAICLHRPKLLVRRTGDSQCHRAAGLEDGSADYLAGQPAAAVQQRRILLDPCIRHQ